MSVLQDSELTLVLSGHMCRPYSADLRPFWRGFIELQRALPAAATIKNILVHSWNPEFSELVDLVYAPQYTHYEKQACFYAEFMHDINPPDLFEKNLDRLHSTWKNVSIQSVIGNARSRARAVALLDSIPTELAQGRVLITRWDLGQSGTAQVNRLVADFALPAENLYLSYYSEVDEGYADMWIFAPWHWARRFSQFDRFVLDSVAGRNRYLEMFTQSGWPRSCKKSWREALLLSHPLGQRVTKLLLNSLKKILGYCNGRQLVQRVVRRGLSNLQQFLQRPPLTAENSYVSDRESPLTYPTYVALNVHALLKFFMMSEGMREQTRFLTYEDFDLSAQRGLMINPQPCLSFIWEDKPQADDIIVQYFMRSRLPLSAIYWLGETAVCETYCEPTGRIVTTSVTPATPQRKARLLAALDLASERAWSTLPLLLIPSAETYAQCSDWYYLNALLKYITWSQTEYVGLDSTSSGKPNITFPELEFIRGHGALSFNKAASTVTGIRSFLNGADDLAELTVRADRMLLEFACVAKTRKLF